MKPQRHLPPVSDISFTRNEPQELPCQQGQVPSASKTSSVQMSEMRGTLGAIFMLDTNLGDPNHRPETSREVKRVSCCKPQVSCDS